MSDTEGWKGRRAATPGKAGVLVDAIRTLQRQVAELRTRATLNSASISSGGLRVKDGGGVTVEDGGGVTVADGGGLTITGGGGVTVEDGGGLTIKDGGGVQVLDDGDIDVLGGRVTIGDGGDLIVADAGALAARYADDSTACVFGPLYAQGTRDHVGHGLLIQHPNNEDIVRVLRQNDGVARVWFRGSDTTVRAAGSGGLTLAAEAGPMNLWQDVGSAQWLIGRSSSAAAGTRSYIWSPSGGDDIYLVGDLKVSGSLNVDGAKQFRTRHPLREGYDLAHASTESPVSGVEYWGEGVIGADGTAAVALPYYFEALVKPTGRAVLVSPIGPPSPLGADRVVDGTFTVHGEPGAEFSWLVKGERFGGDFDVEPVTWNPQPEEFPNTPEPEEAP
ncbi:hypothetical protein ACQP60_04160 [Isoptericola variabilis]|uniref:hypothetical protein n=1 Tax=Isoptericola variabilis TaxID=139208 RepID=UPI003D195F79